MSELKKFIVKLFIVTTFLMAFTTSIIDSVFDTSVMNVTDEKLMVFALVVYFAVTIGVYVLGTLLFTYYISKRTEKENNRYYQEKSMLFANIAHDLKTPLTTIIGFSKALHDGEITDENERLEMLLSIQQKSESANKLLDLMFQYTKFSSLDFELHPEKYDIVRLLRETVAEHYEGFEEKHIQLELDIPEKAVFHDVDKLEFSRALSNLFINAYLHNSEKSKVLIRFENNNSSIKIIVADTGDEISDDMMDIIFEPFICGDESRSTRSGSGLGLAITKKIIEKHNSTIVIDTDIDDYTKGFVIRL